jgi:hypothetical protein
MGYTDRGWKEQGYGDMYVPASLRSRERGPAGGGRGGVRIGRMFDERATGRGVFAGRYGTGRLWRASPVARSDA